MGAVHSSSKLVHDGYDSDTTDSDMGSLVDWSSTSSSNEDGRVRESREAHRATATQPSPPPTLPSAASPVDSSDRMSLASDPLRSCPQSGQRESKPSFPPSLAVVAARASCLPLRWWLARSEARMASRVEATQVKCLSRSLFHRPRGVHFVVGPLRGSAQRMAQPSYGPRFKPRLRWSRVAVGGASASATAVSAAAYMTQMRAHQKKSQKT